MGIILVRHTTLKVAAGTCYGRTDLQVADTFNAEADKVVQNLPKANTIISSPLTRCRQLAKVIASARKLDVKTDARLQEMDFGSWEGQRWSDIPREELDAWATDFLNARPHGGESVTMLRERVIDAIADYQACEGPHLLITHAGVIKAALSDGDGADNFSTQVDFGGIVRLPKTNPRSVM